MNDWIRRPQPSVNARLRLFCFLYAGGSTMVFRHWDKGMPSSVEVCAQLPGHGDHLKEPPLTTVPAVVDALIPKILPFLDRPFALFGHSIGALICFELTRQLRQHKHPEILLFSGRRAPQVRDRTPQLHTLPDAELVTELRQFNGTPQQVLDNAEMMQQYLMQQFLPILRADFSICGTYQYRQDAPLDCPIVAFGVAFGGKRDRAEPPELLKDWKHQTTRSFSLHLPGDHFFLNTHQQAVVDLIRQELNQL